MDEGEGIPVTLVVNHRAKAIDCEAGKVTFEDGTTIEADLIVGADGIRVRTQPLQSHSHFLIGSTAERYPF